MISFLFLIVITDPYADIKYGEVDVYEYGKHAHEKPKRKRYRKKRRTKKKRIWCPKTICDPPRWIYRK